MNDPNIRAPRLLDRYREEMLVRRYAKRTITSYVTWVRRYLRYHHLRHPREMGQDEINAFLTHLAVNEKLSASSQNQALGALLFLYRTVLGGDVGSLDGVVRGHRPRRLPVVLTEKEVRIVLGNLQGTSALVAQILYGSGLRLMEALCLRIKDVDFEKNSIVVRDGKGDKDRITMLPASLKVSLQAHLTNVFALHQKDLSDGWGRVELMLWLESMSMLRRSGAGNGCFRNSIAGGIEGVENKDVITWIVAWYRKRCVQQCKQQASTSPPSVTHCAILLLLTCSNTVTIFARFKNYWDIAT